MNSAQLLIGLYLFIIAYLLYEWIVPSKKKYEEELKEILDRDQYKVKGRFD